ncbi:MAG: hypothetical protein LBI82_07645 [Dysgonamonadaceae bacterium]|jgi:hypothetical protein|nr:hypothetical protein [Dysgonamonadaceae bacterium]
MKVDIYQVITALIELEAKGCHSVFFEYGNGLFRARIFKVEASAEKTVYEKTINPVQEQAELEELYNHIENMKLYIYTTVFQCYRQEFVKGKKAGEWEKIKPSFEFGKNATLSMQIGGLGNFIDDPDNGLQYFVDMKQLSETDK